MDNISDSCPSRGVQWHKTWNDASSSEDSSIKVCSSLLVRSVGHWANHLTKRLIPLILPNKRREM